MSNAALETAIEAAWEARDGISPATTGETREAIEDTLKVKAKRNYMDMQMGDVPATWADGDLLKRLTGYQPQTDVRHGIEKFVAWFRDYYAKQGNFQPAQ